jgi:hypothetical protein
MATVLKEWEKEEVRSVIRFLWAKKLHLLKFIVSQ